MKKLPFYILLLGVIAVFSACGEDEAKETWEEYAKWRETNEQWMTEQANRTNPDGSPYFTKLTPDWDPGAYVLIHYFNDRKATEGNLSPLFTSTVDVKYHGRLYNDEPFDSSYLRIEPADSVYRTKCSNVIEGWTIALEDMRIGDSCLVVIPYQQGYGSANQGSIKPYSALQFNMKLVGIPGYEIKPRD